MGTGNNVHRIKAYINNVNAFRVVINAISTRAGFVVNFISHHRILAALSFIIKPSASIRLRKVSITVNNTLFKLRQSFTNTVRVRPVKITSVLSQILRITGQTVSLKKISITPVLRLRYKLGSVTVALKKITIAAILSVARYQTLHTFDPNRLSVQDTQTLESMDAQSS